MTLTSIIDKNEIKRHLGWLEDGGPYCPDILRDVPCSKPGNECDGIEHKTVGWIIQAVLRDADAQLRAQGIQLEKRA